MQPPLARSILVGRGYNLQEFDTKYDKDHSIFTKKCFFILLFDVMVKYCYAHMCILKQSIYQISDVAQGPLIIMFSIHS